jgi:hypothetical protein
VKKEVFILTKKPEVIDIQSNEQTAVAVVAPVGDALTAWANNIMVDMDLGSFYSIKPTTVEGKIALFNAINNPDKRLADFINMEISVKDVLVEIVELESEQTGQLEKCPRIILIDTKGVSYQCVSVGIMSGLKRIFKLFGEPTWTTPVKVRVKQITKGEKKMLSLEVIL